MKVAIFLLCLIPLVLSEKRLLIDSILDTTEISKLVSSLITKFGSDPSEAECEAECLQLFTNDLLDSACDFACKGIQTLIQKVPHQTITNAPTAST